MSDSLWPHGLYSPWNSLGQNTGVGSLSLHQGISPTRGSNPGLPHFGRILYQLSHQESPCKSSFFLVHEKDFNNSISSRNYNNFSSMYSTFWLSHHSDPTISQARADVRAIWLRHLSPHWSPGLIWLIGLSRQVSPSSLTAPCASLPKLRARSKRTTIPIEEDRSSVKGIRVAALPC